ncbi:MAG: molybdopterin molybdenumtransferase MoeA, partial [Bacteroidota bacterium]
MISVSEASRLVLSHLWSPSEVFVALADASGRVLSRDIYADRDLPPYNRVAMDGIAIRQADFLNGVLEYQISGVAAAGDPPRVMETCG